jgi:hypothetical protein
VSLAYDGTDTLCSAHKLLLRSDVVSLGQPKCLDAAPAKKARAKTVTRSKRGRFRGD